MNELLKLIESNPELKAKVEALNQDPKATAADFIALAKEYGVEITEADFQSTPAEGELSDDELEAVAGGKECYCAIGGGGTGDDYVGTCACVALGFGDDQGGGFRCTCAAAGFGSER